MTLRRETLVTAITILVIAFAMVAALVDTIETGRVYIFSRQFLEEIPRRFTGPGRFRFILQPAVAIVLGVRSGAAAIRNLLAAGIIMDLAFQLVLYRSVHPGAALLVGPIFICGPYVLSRAISNRMTRWTRRS